MTRWSRANLSMKVRSNFKINVWNVITSSTWLKKWHKMIYIVVHCCTFVLYCCTISYINMWGGWWAKFANLVSHLKFIKCWYNFITSTGSNKLITRSCIILFCQIFCKCILFAASNNCACQLFITKSKNVGYRGTQPQYVELETIYYKRCW